VRLKDGDLPPFFCVHPLDGHVLALAHVARHLEDGQPFVAIQARGVEGEAEPSSSVGEMAAWYVDAIRAAQPEGPYYLGGYSMGGLIAHEMARRLREMGEEVALLALIDSPAIHLPEELAGLDVRPVRYAELLEDSGDADASAGEAELPALARVREAHTAAVLSHAPGAYDGPVVYLRATGQIAGLADAVASWRRFAAEVEVHDVPGDHFSIVREPNVRELARVLGAAISTARGALATA
jgi:thioesterase domain-containing protein